MAVKKSNSPKKVFINLKTKGEYNSKRQFELQQALKLLRLPNSGWEIEDELYTFENNDIKRRTSKESNKTAKE